MAISSLQNAKAVKNDEFYTQLADIENELKHYKDQLKDKIVFCNCDDPFESNFFKYFAMNFNQLGLKKLIATCYDPSPIANTQLSLFGDDVPIKHKGMKKFANHAYKIELNQITDVDDNGSIGIPDVEKMLENEKNTLKNGGKSDILTYLDGDGDFRSDECVKLLVQADVVITNPPFSLFREYIAQLIKYNKKFLIIGNKNSINNGDVFKAIKDGNFFIGNRPMAGGMWFIVEGDSENYDKVVNGQRMKNVPTTWFTNLDVAKRHEWLTLYRKYNPTDYLKYDNYDAIEVSQVADIPEDYDGLMGVPITFLDKYNPDQFELIGIPTGNLGKEIGVTKNYRGRTDISITKDGKTSCPFSRIIIKRKELK